MTHDHFNRDRDLGRIEVQQVVEVTRGGHTMQAMTQGIRNGSSREDILRLFAAAVADLGYDQVSLSMVAKQLNLSKGTIVYHFETKEKILEAVHRDYMVRRLAEAKAIFQELIHPRERIVAILAQLLIAQRDDRAATVAFAREFVRFASIDLMHDVRVMRHEYSELLRNVIEDGMVQGVLRKENAELVTLQIFGMCNWAWTWLSQSPVSSIEEVIETWARSLMSGIAVARGGRPVRDVVDTAKVIRVVEGIMSVPV